MENIWCAKKSNLTHLTSLTLKAQPQIASVGSGAKVAGTGADVGAGAGYSTLERVPVWRKVW